MTCTLAIWIAASLGATVGFTAGIYWNRQPTEEIEDFERGYHRGYFDALTSREPGE